MRVVLKSSMLLLFNSNKLYISLKMLFKNIKLLYSYVNNGVKSIKSKIIDNMKKIIHTCVIVDKQKLKFYF